MTSQGLRTLLGLDRNGNATDTYRHDGVDASIGSTFCPVDALRLGLGASFQCGVLGLDSRAVSTRSYALNPWLLVGLRRERAEVHLQYATCWFTASRAVPLHHSHQEDDAVRHQGVEPRSVANQANVLPLNEWRKMVDVVGFDPTTSCSRSRRAPRLRYTPLVVVTVPP